ncbi:hydrogenase isoenzymes formation protein HypD [Psychromonas sp. CNPT3]|uniref:hydrogenase formation protein HypD n=1 Tax=Psychromonas sp. CNPT3 TaxID=314282 RepID=UPI00006E8912|nr:hydrogenase formation protein HypD [Psychromonas sp. CNPT3]AGH82397.1 hydrogenase isoenzymes formation protein HypD [Psychromonas sp. CNPT3]
MDLKELYQTFRDPLIMKALAKKINTKAKQLPYPLKVMEVCGGHTHTIMKYGLMQLLPDNIEFIHGPGCPVCIMPKERIDQAIDLAMLPNTILVTLGDMIRVPGSKGTLAQCRARGGDVRPIYDPMDTLLIAKENPTKSVIYFAIGFETTTPMTAVLVQIADQQKLCNFYVHCNHVLVPPAINAVMSDGRAKINAFIGPSHVSVITGAKIYQHIADKYKLPVVVAGFEPVDVMQSILMLVELSIATDQHDVTPEMLIQYSRAVTLEGNLIAQSKINEVFELRDVFRWRGLGDIANSALKLREKYARFDAELIFKTHLSTKPIDDHKACQCGDILRGLAKPNQCKVFAKNCTPTQPMGSCMVSSEGACNAYFRYLGLNNNALNKQPNTQK